jgi:ABC-type branched-subunit amino acid transport system substrate-binding protein
MRTIRHRAALPIFVAVALVIAASCGGTTEGGTPISSKSDPSLMGPSKPATGTPIKVGLITEGKTAVIDNTGMEAAANSAVKYVNEHLGGIKGHPIEIVLCQTQATPAGSADCANKMIADKVPVVLGATPAAPAPIVSALQGASIPYFIDTAVDQASVLSPNTYVLTNTLGFLASPVIIAKQNNHKKVATILIDVPAAVGPIKALGQPYYDKAGIENSIVAIPPGTPDMTPQVQAELSKNPEMFVIVGDPGFCTAGLGALETLGFEGTKFINSQCLSPDLHTAVAGGIGGVLVGATSSLSSSDPEVALYDAVMEAYAPDVEAHATATPEGYAIVVALARAMESGLQGDAFTPESVKAAFAAMTPQTMPLLAGETFKCDRQLFKLTPAVCSSAIAVIKMNDDGTPGPSEAIDVLPIING